MAKDPGARSTRLIALAGALSETASAMVQLEPLAEGSYRSAIEMPACRTLPARKRCSSGSEVPFVMWRKNCRTRPDRLRRRCRFNREQPSTDRRFAI
jgi:hypothetical protein